MNAFILLMKLRTALSGSLAHLPLETRLRAGSEEALRALPEIYLGSLPPKAKQDNCEAPLILLQALSGHERDGWQHVDVAVRLLVYNADPEACENDMLNLIGICRRCLLEYRQVALAGRFVLEESDGGLWLPWTIPDEQAAPFCEAHIMASWKMQGFE